MACRDQEIRSLCTTTNMEREHHFLLVSGKYFAIMARRFFREIRKARLFSVFLPTSFIQ